MLAGTFYGPGPRPHSGLMSASGGITSGPASPGLPCSFWTREGTLNKVTVKSPRVASLQCPWQNLPIACCHFLEKQKEH